jgi:hypothetical protein
MIARGSGAAAHFQFRLRFPTSDTRPDSERSFNRCALNRASAAQATAIPGQLSRCALLLVWIYLLNVYI